MKTEILPEVFQPITIQITIESELELAWLHACSNCSAKTARDNVKRNEYFTKQLDSDKVYDAQTAFYNTVTKAITMRGLPCSLTY